MLSIAATCICTARRLSGNIPTFDMAFSLAIEMEGPYLPYANRRSQDHSTGARDRSHALAEPLQGIFAQAGDSVSGSPDPFRSLPCPGVCACHCVVHQLPSHRLTGGNEGCTFAPDAAKTPKRGVAVAVSRQWQAPPPCRRSAPSPTTSPPATQIAFMRPGTAKKPPPSGAGHFAGR